jgi:hypothetical protein
MNTIRAVLNSGWTDTGGTLAWLLFIVGLLVRMRTKSPRTAGGQAQLWDDRAHGGADE